MLIFLLFFSGVLFGQDPLYLDHFLEKESILSNDFFQFGSQNKANNNTKFPLNDIFSTSPAVEPPLPVDAADQSGYTLLHWSIISKDIFLLTNTLKRGADVNLADREGKTPLHWAVEAESLEMIEALIHHGAVVNARDKQGMTPLHKAALLTQGTLIADYLIIYGAAIFTTDNNGHTALDLARINSNRPMMEYLSGMERSFFRAEEY